MVKSILAFLSGLLQFIPWFINRKDARVEAKHQTKAVKDFQKNEDAINKLRPTRRIGLQNREQK